MTDVNPVFCRLFLRDVVQELISVQNISLQFGS